MQKIKLTPLEPERFIDPKCFTRFACLECGRCEKNRLMPFVPKGWTKSLLIVGVVPKSDGHRWLRQVWRKYGWEDKDVALVPSVRHSHDPDDAPTMKQIRCCRPFLVRALEVLEPQKILACGLVALRALTNVGRGSVLEARGLLQEVAAMEGRGFPPFYVTYHPEAVLLGGSHLEPRIHEDFQRMNWGELESPEDNHHLEGDTLAVDFEYSPEGEFLTIGVSDGSRAVASEDEKVTRMLGEYIENASGIVGHNVPVDVDQLVKLDMATPELVWGQSTEDTFLWARMIDENRGMGGYRLESQLRSYFNVVPWKHKTEAYSVTDATEWPPDLRQERCRLDAWATRKLYQKQRAVNFKSREIPEHVSRLQHRISMTLQRIHHAGLVINLEAFDRLGEERRRKSEYHAESLRREAFRVGMTDFEPGNENHIRELLFNRLGLPVREKTKKSKIPKVDRAALSLDKDNPIVQHVLDFKKANKVVSTWYGKEGDDERGGIDSLLRRYDSRRAHLHVNLIPIGARTWRRASRNPNTQNWPEEVREIVVSRFSGGKILNVDYKQLEPTILAWVTGEQRMLEHFRSGKGYIGIGEDFFGTSVEKGTDEYRFIKSIVLGIGYGMGPWKLAHDMWAAGNKLADSWKKHVKKCEKAIEKYFNLFPGVEKYIKKVETAILKRGAVKAPDGAIRHLPAPDGRDTPGWKHIRNEGINYPIQHFASIITGCALLDVERRLVERYRDGNIVEYHKSLLEDPITGSQHTLIINEVHDSLVFDMHPDHLEEDLQLITSTMSEIPSMREYCPKFPLNPGVDYNLEECWRSK